MTQPKSAIPAAANSASVATTAKEAAMAGRPKGWKEVSIDEVCDLVNGKTPSRSKQEYWEGGTVPWFTIDDIRANGRIISDTKQHITEEAVKKSGLKMVPKDSILICCTASIGEYAYVAVPLTTNQQFNAMIIKDKRELDPKYLYYIAHTIGNLLHNLSGTTTFGFVSKARLGSIKILMPPLKEQQKIAGILSSVDAEIEAVDKEIATAERLKRGLMLDLLSGRVRVV